MLLIVASLTWKAIASFSLFIVAFRVCVASCFCFSSMLG